MSSTEVDEYVAAIKKALGFSVCSKALRYYASSALTRLAAEIVRLRADLAEDYRWKTQYDEVEAECVRLRADLDTLQEECEKLGLPVDLGILLRHIRGNNSLVVGLERETANILQARAERAEQALRELIDFLDRGGITEGRAGNAIAAARAVLAGGDE